jgi:hypothetical protein
VTTASRESKSTNLRALILIAVSIPFWARRASKGAAEAGGEVARRGSAGCEGEGRGPGGGCERRGGLKSVRNPEWAAGMCGLALEVRAAGNPTAGRELRGRGRRARTDRTRSPGRGRARPDRCASRTAQRILPAEAGAGAQSAGCSADPGRGHASALGYPSTVTPNGAPRSLPNRRPPIRDPTPLVPTDLPAQFVAPGPIVGSASPDG